ncbi:precorrin-8X methylmutase [Aceticella autotrophica]|uniref:Precorrin-8X methylmutase n=2 Tax=Aceticella autotrophica TaxID=2755338 RepID=A0A975AXQ8_9THEO|nr:precorrin-8X methylmutase [Aceticella autotrophica]
MMYIKNPKEIEKRSFEIIGENIDEKRFDERELKIVKRVIHTTADFEFADILKISKEAIDTGIKAIKEGSNIVTDTKMAMAGINKKTLKRFGCDISCFIDAPEVLSLAKEKSITRSMASMIIASQDKKNKIFVIGNAPTALFQLAELIKSGILKPDLIIGVPVGFVGAAESKEEVKELGIPYIITEGRKGGSNIAAAIINALMYMIE